jgi:hypothetical protein
VIPEGVEVSLPEQEGRARINQPEAEKEEPITEIAPPLVRKERKAAPAKNPERAPESAPAKPSPAKKDKFVQSRQEVMQFEPVTRGRFEKSEPTIVGRPGPRHPNLPAQERAGKVEPAKSATGREKPQREVANFGSADRWLLVFTFDVLTR